MFINTTFSISLIIKLLFLILFILITIYLLSLENEIAIRSNRKSLLQSSSRLTKNIRDGVFIYGPAIIAYQSLIDRWSSTETNFNATSKENDHDLVIKKLKFSIQIQKDEINIHKALKLETEK